MTYNPKKSNLHILNIKPQFYPHLDYFLISDDLIGLTKCSMIITGFKTDHSNAEFTSIMKGKAKGQDIRDLINFIT